MHILYLTGIILALFLALLLISKKNKTTADYILAPWLLAIAYPLFSYYLVFSGQHLTYPLLTALGFSLPVAQGPFLYLYTFYQTHTQRFNRWHLLHFVPVLFCFLLYWDFYFLDYEAKIERFKHAEAYYQTESYIRLWITYLSGVAYISLSLYTLLRYRKHLPHRFSNTERIHFNWLLYLISGLALVWIIILFWQKDEIIFGSSALFIIWLGFFGIKQAGIFHHTTSTSPTVPPPAEPLVIPDNPLPLAETGAPSKYQRSPLSEADIAGIHHRLNVLMLEEQPYKNPDLTLQELATRLGVHPNHLSQVINSKEEKNFYDLINENRIHAFLKAVQQPETQHYTLLAIAFECGFNSKASFNRNFKKYTGQTPSDYLKDRKA